MHRGDDVSKLPVLVLAYNRPDFTVELLKRVSEYSPTRLYVACDGPKESKPGDAELVTEVREALVAPSWECHVDTRFLEANAGSRLAVGGAIDWLFEREEEGIILEDDCMPTADFFRFAEHALTLYRHNSSVWGIAGANNAGYMFEGGSSYGFVRFPVISGWATWANRWKKHDFSLETYKGSTRSMRKKAWPSLAHKLAFERHLDWMVSYGKPDAWDYPLAWSVMREKGLWVVPSAHLVQHVGFRQDSTNVTSKKLMGGPLTPLGDISDPADITYDPQAEIRLLNKLHLLLTPLWLNFPINTMKRFKKKLVYRLPHLRFHARG